SLHLHLNQTTAGSGAGAGQAGDQQKVVNQITPVLFSGMFLFFPLPAGVLMYIVVANIFQTIQTFILSREPLPENLQEIVEQQEKEAKRQAAKSGEGREALPFEPKRSKKKASS
ncbi:MAG: membrane protein insertase YidC, partial [Moorea sp. SIO1F2]|nr:membrane protein insertase YidC [Moorena sp. SIO1F2]